MEVFDIRGAHVEDEGMREVVQSTIGKRLNLRVLFIKENNRPGEQEPLQWKLGFEVLSDCPKWCEFLKRISESSAPW